MQTVNEDDVCQTCQNTYKWHLENAPVHPFNNGSMSAKTSLPSRRDQRRANGAQRGSETPQIAGMPTDPVLRIALINAGVITPAQLAAAEEALRQALAEVRTNGEGKVQERTATQVDVG